MDLTAYAPRLLTPTEMDVHQRRHILLALAQRFDDILLNLEVGPPHYLGPTLSVPVMVAMFRPWAHPLLTDQNVLDLTVGLVAALRAQRTYELYGEWSEEDNDALAGRSHEDRQWLLAVDVNRCVNRLITALEPVQ